MHFISYYDIYWTNLLIVAKVHNVLVLHFDVEKLSKLGKGNLVGVKLGLSRNLSENYFQRSSRSGLKTTSNEKSLVAKVAGNFPPHVLYKRFVSIGVRMRPGEARQVGWPRFKSGRAEATCGGLGDLLELPFGP